MSCRLSQGRLKDAEQGDSGGETGRHVSDALGSRAYAFGPEIYFLTFGYQNISPFFDKLGSFGKPT